MRLSVIVCLLEESEGCLPAVMIFLQQRKDLLDHLSNENSQQKAAGWSLHVVALKPNPPALPLPLILLLALFFPTKSLFHTLRFFHLYSRHSSPPCICKSAFYRRSLPQSIPSLFSPHGFHSVLMSNEASPAVVAPSSNNTSADLGWFGISLLETKKKTDDCPY